ncbi:hypothetical protein [Gramella sp. AN32]|uniref:DUF3575 domain-containing protein n=1 Tax=Christiangramia antarctica TaxID=2058158 RepID=A0ABW5WY25_9FLAO|nr:hypothetical protein [Gramella sp. AN32]MCM4156796.1 hypothetical protein [Gramella sp. AN32]
MKKILALLLISIITHSVTSQEETDKSEIKDNEYGRNELSINAFNLVAFGIVDITYERIINANSTWAVEGFLYLKNEEYADGAYYKDLSLTGKYKHFFSSKYARGFYVHGFGMLSSGNYNYNYYYDYDTGIETRDSDDYTDFAIGFGLGGKFVSSGGFLLDVSAGIGRNLLHDNSPEIVGQFMVNLGYRF